MSKNSHSFGIKLNPTRKWISLGLFFLVSISLFPNVHAHSNSPKEAEQAKLAEILKRCAEYCERLENSSLFFVCKERIKEVGYHPTRGATNVYVYDYQLIRKDNKIKENRILIEENGLKKHIKDARLKTRFFYHKNILFGPYGLLSESRQRHYEYKIIKERRYMGKKAVVIEAVPKSIQVSKDLYGKIWVAKADSSILKIEWNPRSMENFNLIEARAKTMGATPEIKMIAEYGFEKSGIRFPSEFSIIEDYKRQRFLYRILRSKTTVSYKDYKFFTVETRVKYKVPF